MIQLFKKQKAMNLKNNESKIPLIGKCKDDFINSISEDKRLELFLPEVYLYALIIEFFDSVNIYIGIKFYNGVFEYYVNNSINRSSYGARLTRQEAISDAIKDANKMYN